VAFKLKEFFCFCQIFVTKFHRNWYHDLEDVNNFKNLTLPFSTRNYGSLKKNYRFFMLKKIIWFLLYVKQILLWVKRHTPSLKVAWLVP
jgi:hypothetical protein